VNHMKYDRYTYRGKALSDQHVTVGEWVYGGLFKTKDGCWIVRLAPGEYCDGIIQHIRVDPATVGQCTGLPDKNGTAIFAGDVLDDGEIHGGRRRPFEVYWTDGFGFMISHTTGFSVERPLENFGQFQTVSHVTQMTVIGNIHDNPELLEVGV